MKKTLGLLLMVFPIAAMGFLQVKHTLWAALAATIFFGAAWIAGGLLVIEASEEKRNAEAEAELLRENKTQNSNDSGN